MRATQLGLDGGEAPVQGLSLNDKVDWILERYPETQANDNLLYVRCWQHFDGMEKAIGKAAMGRLVTFMRRGHVTKGETYRRRRQETQRLREEAGDLRPSDDVVLYRRERDGAGPPGRKK